MATHNHTFGEPGRPSAPEGTAGLLQRLIDHLPAMVAHWDADCRNRAANAAYLQWFGMRPEEMVGIHIRDLLGPELYAANRPFIEGVLRGEEQQFDRDLVDTAGRMRHTQASYVPDVVDGTVRGFFVLVAEITDRVAAERALQSAAERYRALAHSLPNSFLLLFDDDLRYQVADGHGLEVFGLSRESMEGRTLAEVLPDRASELTTHYRAALAGGSKRWEWGFGGRFFSITTGPVTDDAGTVVAGLVIGTDVTAERQLALTQSALRRVALAAAEHAPVAEVADLVATTLLDLVACDRASVLRFEGDVGHIVAVLPSRPEGIGDTVPLDHSTASGQVAETGRPASVVYGPESTGGAGVIYQAGIRRAVAAPIVMPGGIWGSIAVSLPPRHTTVGSVEDLLGHFADVVSIAISNNEAWEELARQALTDSLTGLPNRRAFDERLASEAVRSARRREFLGVAVIDLDHFKAVNDEYGHGEGDDVLAEVARRLEAATRGDEVVARIGGEEFGVVMPGCGPVDAWGPGERFRRAIGDEPFGSGLTLTASVGVCVAAGSAIVGDTLLEVADRALYRAKQRGRDRVVVEQVKPTSPPTCRTKPEGTAPG